MTSRKLIGMAALGLLVLILGNIVSATATFNSVPQSSVSQDQRATTANHLKPPGCDSLDLAKQLSGSGTFGNGSASALVLGGSGADDIEGGGGDDCIAGGAGDDNLVGGTGNDVCLGGKGNDTYDASCEIR